MPEADGERRRGPTVQEGGDTWTDRRNASQWNGRSDGCNAVKLMGWYARYGGRAECHMQHARELSVASVNATHHTTQYCGRLRRKAHQLSCTGHFSQRHRLQQRKAARLNHARTILSQGEDGWHGLHEAVPPLSSLTVRWPLLRLTPLLSDVR